MSPSLYLPSTYRGLRRLTYVIHSLKPSGAHIVSKTTRLLVQIHASSAPSHYMNQCWIIVIANVDGWHFSLSLNTKMLINEQFWKYIDFIMVAILSLSQCVKNCKLPSTSNMLYPITCWQGSIHGKSYSWWRHQMQTFSALLAICAGNSPVTGEFTAQRPVKRSFDVFFGLRLNKRLMIWYAITPNMTSL